MKKLVTLIPTVLLAATMFASHPVAANAVAMPGGQRRFHGKGDRLDPDDG